MKRATIERFISKYNLGGSTGAVNWRASGGKVRVSSASDSQNAVAFITAPIGLDDGEYAIMDTAQLRSIVGVLGDDFGIVVKKQNGVPTAFEMKDEATKATFALGEPAMLPKEPVSNVLPSSDLVITLDEQLVASFVRAKTALSDADSFAVIVHKGKNPQLVLGYAADQNTNTIALEARGESAVDLPIAKYDAKLTREILLANREASGGRMGLSKAGLLHLEFDVEGFVVDYYLTAVQK